MIGKGINEGKKKKEKGKREKVSSEGNEGEKKEKLGKGRSTRLRVRIDGAEESWKRKTGEEEEDKE